MNAGGDTAHLRYIRHTAATLHHHATSLGQDRWMADGQAQAATSYQLQTLAESATKLSEGVKARHPDLPWRDIAGMRDHLAHDHLRVDPAIVWSTVVHDVPKLGALAAHELARRPAPAGRDGPDLGR